VSGAVAKKLGVKEGSRAIFVGAPDGAMATVDPPSLDLASALRGEFDYIHFFAKTRAGMDRKFPRLKAHLAPGGMLWVSWPKSGKLRTDLDMKEVIRIGYRHGLVESKAVSVDDTWSALKFTHPKAGKVYKNSYGRLPSP
jgi:hypothetical protein